MIRVFPVCFLSFLGGMACIQPVSAGMLATAAFLALASCLLFRRKPQ